MYQARLHPEQYSNTFTDAQVKKLHDAMMFVCNTAVDLLAESDKFPADWLMKHRWTKGKKGGAQLPNGDKITFLTVGGRTSAVVPSVQKKTGVVAGDVSDEADGSEEVESKPKKAPTKKKGKPKKETEEDEESEAEIVPKSTKRGKNKIKDEEEEFDGAPPAKKPKSASKAALGKGKKTKAEPVKTEDVSGRRRSGRLSKG